MNTTTISEQLRAWRAAAGLSQPQAAQRLGVPEGTYLHWEHGDRVPSAFAQRAIALCIASKPGLAAPESSFYAVPGVGKTAVAASEQQQQQTESERQ